ncbi:hypothetical protein Tco_0497725 [Tanacetum coccineum]
MLCQTPGVPQMKCARMVVRCYLPGRGSSVPIDLFTAFALTQPCMRTRSQSRNQQQQQQIPPIVVESLDLEDLIKDQESPVVTMADNRTMAELLQAPTEGYEDAIVVPAITADNFELKHSLLTLVQNKQFFGHDKEDPHAHIRYFNKITSTLRFPNVPNTSIKLAFFHFLLEGPPGFA